MTNKQTVQAMYDAFSRGDIQSILDRLSDHIRWEEWPDNSAQKAGVPWMKRRTKNEIPDFFRVVGEMEIIEFKVNSLMEGDNKVAAEFVFEAIVPGTGRRYRDEQVHVWTFDASGKAIGFRHYLDTAKHMAAAGVSERVASNA